LHDRVHQAVIEGDCRGRVIRREDEDQRALRRMVEALQQLEAVHCGIMRSSSTA
jgi:hypothetical protein